MDWNNHLGKKSDPKNRKNSKNQSEIAECEQKTTSEKANFCSNTFFSLYFKIRAQKFHAAKPLAFSLHFLFRRDQNHYQFEFKNHENVWTDLKKKIAGRIPETNRSGNPFKCHPITHQTKRASNNLRLSWNKTLKQKVKKIKSIKIWLKIWSISVINWYPKQLSLPQLLHQYN